MRERDIQKKIVKFLVSKGAYVVKQHGSMYTRAGIPDLLICHKGRFLAIEVKRAEGILTDLQKYHLEQIKKASGQAIVARSVEDAERIIND